MGSLDGKVAIVTGGGRGVGRAEALLLAKHGASVIVNDLGSTTDGAGADSSAAESVVEEIRSKGGTASANTGDVADWDDGKALVEQAISEYGGLDVLVCNAGILRDRMIFKMSEEEFDSVLRVHLKGHFVPTRFATAHWRDEAKASGEKVKASIIYTGSGAGLFGNAGQYNYASAKAAIAAAAIVVARECEKYGVRANTVCPSARTRLVEVGLGPEGATDGTWDPRSAENVAPLVAYLGSDESQHINGQTFWIGGGKVELWSGWRLENEIERDGPWELETLSSSINDLFGDRPTWIPERPPPRRTKT